MTDDERPDRPDDAADDQRGRALRDLLGGAASDDVRPAPDADDVADLRRRAGHRRQRKAAGLATVAVLLVLLGGSAFALGHRSTDAGQVDLASNVGAGPDTRYTTTIPTYATPPPGLCPTVAGGDGSSVVACAGSNGTGIVSGTGPAIPDTTLPETTTQSTEDTTTSGPTAPPVTTIPSSSSSSHPTMPTTVPAGQDCGASTPSGWPTTTVAPPTLAQCLIDGFQVGAPNTLRVVRYVDDPDHPVTTTYVVVGVHQVKVTIDARKSAVPPQTLTTQVCTTLTTSFGSSDVVSATDCTPA